MQESLNKHGRSNHKKLKKFEQTKISFFLGD